MIAVGIVVERRVAPSLGSGSANMGEVPPALRRASRALVSSFLFRLAGGIAILALMTLKPDATGASAIVGTGVVVGILSALRPSPRRAAAAT